MCNGEGGIHSDFEEVVGLRCSVQGVAPASSQRQQPDLQGVTTPRRAYYTPYNIGRTIRTYGSQAPYVLLARQSHSGVSPHSVSSSSTTSSKDTKMAASPSIASPAR